MTMHAHMLQLQGVCSTCMASQPAEACSMRFYRELGQYYDGRGSVTMHGHVVILPPFCDNILPSYSRMTQLAAC